MKLEVKALQMSLAIHTLLLLLVFSFSRDSFNAHKLVVIDLTLMDPITAATGTSGNKKTHAAPEPEMKHQKAETESKLTQDNENTQLAEQVPGVETVPMIHDSKLSPVSEDQGGSDSAGTFLASTKESPEDSSRDGGALRTDTKQVFGKGSGNNGQVITGYLKSHLSYIKDMIQKNITYPDIARRNGWMGKVKVSFIIVYNGYAKNIEVIQSSGFKILDKNAIEAIKNASPFPKPPVEAQIIIPIVYKLH
jgi:protein TonB